DDRRLDPGHGDREGCDEDPCRADVRALRHRAAPCALTPAQLGANERIRDSTRSTTSSGVDVPAVRPTVPASRNQSAHRSASAWTWWTRAQYSEQVSTSCRVLLLEAPPTTMTTSARRARSMAAAWRCLVGRQTVSLKRTSAC